MRTVGVIQARTGSTRLPGKVLLPLLGEPVLAHVVRRVARARLLDEVVIATTVEIGDDAIEELARVSGWACVRGSEADLVDRYLLAAHSHRADVVVRVTSDCPLIDPEVIDGVVAALVGGRADYASNTLPPRTYPRGLDAEALTVEALERADREDVDPASREHATPYLYGHPELFRLVPVPLPGGEDHADLRWTLDTPEDYQLITAIYEELGDDTFTWRDALAATERNPAWAGINGHIRQKHL